MVEHGDVSESAMKYLFLLLFCVLVAAALNDEKRCTKISRKQHIRQGDVLQLSILDKLQLLAILKDLFIDETPLQLTRISPSKHLFASQELLDCDALACGHASFDRSVYSAQEALKPANKIVFQDTVTESHCHFRFAVFSLTECENIVNSAFGRVQASTDKFWATVRALRPGEYGHLTLLRGSDGEYSLQLTRTGDSQKSNICRCSNHIISQQKAHKNNVDLSHHIFYTGIDFLLEMFEGECGMLLLEMQNYCTGSNRNRENVKLFSNLAPCVLLIDAMRFADLKQQNKLLCQTFTSLIDPELCRLIRSKPDGSTKLKRSNFIGRYLASLLDFASRDELKISYQNTQRVVSDLNHLKSYITAVRQNEDVLATNYKTLIKDFMQHEKEQDSSLSSAVNNTKMLYRLMNENLSIQKVLHRTEVNLNIREVLHSTWSALQRMITVFHLESENIRIQQNEPNRLLLVKPVVSYDQKGFVEISCLPTPDMRVVDVTRVYLEDLHHDTLSGQHYSEKTIKDCIGDLNLSEEAGDCDELLVPVPASFSTIQANQTTVTLFTAQPIRCRVNNAKKAFTRGYHLMPISEVHFIACGSLISVFNYSGFEHIEQEIGEDVQALHFAVLDPEDDKVQAAVDQIIDRLDYSPQTAQDLNIKIIELYNETEQLKNTVVQNPIHSLLKYAVLGTSLIFFVCCSFCVMFSECCSPVKHFLGRLCCTNKYCGHHGERQVFNARRRRWKRNIQYTLLPAQAAKIRQANPTVQHIFNKCETWLTDHNNVNLAELFDQAPVYANKTVGMACVIIIRIREALRSATPRPLVTDDFKWKYKAAMISCGLHFPEGEFVQRDELTSDYIFSNLIDLIPLQNDLRLVRVGPNGGTVEDLTNQLLGTLRQVVPN